MTKKAADEASASMQGKLPNEPKLRRSMLVFFKIAAILECSRGHEIAKNKATLCL
jgi:hypothetical protein